MWSPFVMLLVLAGLVSVEVSLRGAEIDRASWWRRFWTITFPYIRGLLLLALLFRTIEAFKLFDVVFLITEGGPAPRPRPSRCTSTAWRSSISEPEHGARLHPAVHRDRADQPLSLLRQTPGGGDLSHGDAERTARAWRSRLGPDPVRRGDQLHLLLPGAVDHPDRVQDPQRRARDPAQVAVHADTCRTSSRCSRAPTARMPAAVDTGFDLFFFNSIFIAGTSVPWRW